MPIANDTRNVNHQCQIIVFRWDYEANDGITETQMAESTAHDISKYIQQVNMSKSMDAPAGQFQIMLPNNKDWKEVIKKGDWIIIYASNDGDLNIPNSQDDITIGNSGVTVDSISVTKLLKQKNKARMIGRVDTARAQGTTNENGEFDVNFNISGRNYGVVYEETEIWHNQVLYDETLLKTANAKINANNIKTVDGLLKTLHDLIFAPDRLTKDLTKVGSLTSIARQWLLPQKLFTALGLEIDESSSPFYGNIKGLLNLKPTPATFPVESPTALLNGIAWDRLKAHSIEPYHELFVELNDNGGPQLNFRLIPWVVDVKALSLFSDISTVAKSSILYGQSENGQVELNDIDIIEWDLGEDDHTRYNLFWSTLNTSMVTTQTSNSILGNNSPKSGFPRVNQNSIKRHGFRKMFSEVNANIVIGTEKANPDLLRQFNEFALELWQRSHEYESGTMTIIGNNDIKLGKTVLIEENSPYNSNKIFYIEGYEESFLIGDNGEADWTQSLFLTRGIEKSILKDSALVLDRQSPYDNAGNFTGNT